MASSPSPSEDLFSEASHHWDLDRLYTDLATIKQRPLTSKERVCLRGLLCDTNPKDIANALCLKPQGLSVDLTRGLYRYVEEIANAIKINNWREVPIVLAQKGYKKKTHLVAVPDQLQHQFSNTKTQNHHDWENAPDVSHFFGRSQELAQLQQWIVDDQCRMVAIVGMRGIGKTRLSVKLGMGGTGKTNLSLKVAQGIQDQFEFVIWRSLLNAPPLNCLLTTWIKHLSGQQEITVPDDPAEAISQLLTYLKNHRCLLILDNVETILQPGEDVGRYRSGYEGYGQLLQQIGSVAHQSCLLLTSRELPQEIIRLEGKNRPVRSLPLQGLEPDAIKQIFAEIGTFSATEAEWQQLIAFYNGNPLALELVAKHIEDVFDGNIAAFLAEGTPLFHDLRDLLNWHFDRLSDAEQEIMYWLAINREPIGVAELKEDVLSPPIQVAATLQSLRRRFPLERRGNQFAQQPVVMEYVTDRLIKLISHELRTLKIRDFNRYAIVKATTKDYIREIQTRIFFEPIVSCLKHSFQSNSALIEHLNRVLDYLGEHFLDAPGYAGGNLLNLLCHLNADLTESDFSQLYVWQAYLATHQLYQVNFTGSDLSKSVFAETFGGITDTAFSTDGHLLATCDTNGEVQIWQMETGQKDLAFKAETVWAWSVMFSPDGSILATAGDDYQVRLWEVQTGRCLQVLEGHRDTVNAVAFSPSDHLLASGGQDATIRLWSWNPAGKGDCIGILQGHQERVWSIAFSPDGQTLFSSSEDRTIKVWDIATGACLQTWTGHQHWIKTIAISPDGQWIASGSFDGFIKLWERSTGKCLHTWQAHQDCVTSLAFSPLLTSSSNSCSPLLASSGYDQTLKLWEIPTGTLVQNWHAHRNRIWAIAFHPNGQQLVSGGEDHATRLWDIPTGQLAKTWQGHANAIMALDISPDRQYLATGNEDQTVKLWQMETGKVTHTLRGHTNRVWSVAFSPAPSTERSMPTLHSSPLTSHSALPPLLATSSADRTIKLWNPQTGECLRTLRGHQGWVWTIAFHPQGKYLVSGSYDHTLRLWNPNTGECLKTLKGHQASVVCVAFSPDGKTIASSSFDTTIRLWNAETGKCIQTLKGHEHSIWSIAFHPQGKYLVSGSYDKTVKLWDIQSGHCISTFTGHTHPVVCVRFSPNGKYLASGSFDRTIHLWEHGSGQRVQGFPGHQQPISSLCWDVLPSQYIQAAQGNSTINSSLDPSAMTLISSSFDETLKFWDIANGKCWQTWRERRPYDRMNITQIRGLTEAQKATLIALGAIEA